MFTTYHLEINPKAIKGKIQDKGNMIKLNRGFGIIK
jgi:hypothetical protein